MKSVSVAVVIALLGLNLSASPVSGQLWDAGVPGEDLGSLALLFGSVAPQSSLPDGASFASGIAIGGSASWWPFRYVGFRGHVVRAKTDGQEGHEFSSVAFEEPVVWLYSADVAVRYPLVGQRIALAPYIAAGYGGKSYEWSLNRLSAGSHGNTTFGWTLAGGAEIRPGSSGWYGLRLEIANQRSEFRFFEYAGPHPQHEFYRQEAVVHEGVVPGNLEFPDMNDLILSVGVTLNR